MYDRNGGHVGIRFLNLLSQQIGGCKLRLCNEAEDLKSVRVAGLWVWQSALRHSCCLFIFLSSFYVAPTVNRANRARKSNDGVAIFLCRGDSKLY